MPIYDFIYGTVDKTSDALYETSLKRQEEFPDVVHLTHLTTPESIYHMRLGFASLASKPHSSSNWYMCLLWPVTLWSMMITWIYGRTFVVERNRLDKLKLQTWAIPKYNIQVRQHFLWLIELYILRQLVVSAYADIDECCVVFAVLLAVAK